MSPIPPTQPPPSSSHLPLQQQHSQHEPQLLQDIEEAIKRPCQEHSRRRHTIAGGGGGAGLGLEEQLSIGTIGDDNLNNNNHHDSNNNLNNSHNNSTSNLNLSISAISPPVPARRMISDDAPRSNARGLPLTVASLKAAAAEPALIHPILNRVPVHLRFGFYGLLSNVFFMVMYNSAIAFFEKLTPSTIYSIVYLIYIPAGHGMAALLVFGWPDRYCPSLMSNFPIGLTAIALGSTLTAYLDRIQFNDRIEDWIRDNFTFSHMPPRTAAEKSEFYSSLLVLVVTSIWTYILSLYINSPPTKSAKKDL